MMSLGSSGVKVANCLSQRCHATQTYSHTSLISLIAIQLLLPSTNRSNSLGASGRKSWGLLHPSSQTTLTMAAVTVGSSLSSCSLSLILGQAGRKLSGYTNASLYSVTTVFFLMAGCECVNRGSRSDSTEFAILGLITCGIATSGRLMTVGVGLEMSFLSWFSASISTSVSLLKLWTAARYPVRLWRYFGEDMTSRTLNEAHDMS